MHRLAMLFLSWALLQTGTAIAQDVAVPPALQPWESWVMFGEEYRRCPMLAGTGAEDAASFQCQWPGRMRMAVSSSSGDFSQPWRVYGDGWVTLPGDETHWPEDVRVNGNLAPVVAKDGAPRLHLDRGEYTVTGKFVWSRRPESLRVPALTALIDLTIDGRSIAPIELRGDRLWLGAVRTVTVPRAIQVQVYRLIEDGIPLRLTTQLQLKISGDAREEVLAVPLPEGFVPMSISGALPARFEPDGRLRVQVRSGEHVLTIHARAVSMANSIVVPQGEGLWSAEEVWSYRSDDRLRVTAIEAAPPIDPAQADVPDEWNTLPAYRLNRGATITIAERSRGLSNVDANRFTLSRDLWLAFDHRTLIAADKINGTMQQGWRLDMLSPYRLLNAKHANETLLITDGPQGRTGIELRTPTVQVATLSRIENRGPQPATGWDARFDSVRTTLHLPPGHRLFAAWGVDGSPDAWVSRWRLLDLFLLTLVTAAVFRLLGWAGAVIGAGAVLFTYHEPQAPTWLWINLLIAIAVMRAIPPGRLRKWIGTYQLLSVAAMVLALIPFALTQYRLAIHPQLASDEYGQVATRAPLAAQLMVPDMSEITVTAERRQGAPDDLAGSASLSSSREAKRLERYAPDALLQTGPGIPDWHYLSYQLNWSGPVDAGQKVHMAILSPFWLSLWRVLGVLLSAALLLALIRLAYGLPTNWRFPPVRALTAIAPCALVLALITAAVPQTSAAQSPDAATLTELKRRLSLPPKCTPDCTQIVLASVDIDDDRLTVHMDVHAQASVALGVPQAGSQWIIEQVLLDERPSDALARREQQLQLPITAGVHRVSIAGRITHTDELSLEFPQSPRRIAIRAEGWDSSGSSEGHLLNNALQLTRRANSNASEKVTAPQRFPPFVRIHRRVYMNLDWTVTTEVERLAPEDGAFTMRLPLLPGEAVLTPGFEVREGSVLVSMPSGVRAAIWESSLNRLDKVQWTAARDQSWVEQWDVIVSPMWHAEFSGTPAVMPQADTDGMWINEFLPRPGESLDLTVSRPGASAGTTLAVDGVSVNTTFGQRLADTDLAFSYRSSQGGRHNLRLPEDARVKSVMMDEQSLPLRPTDGVLPLTLSPGQHRVSVAFSRDQEVGLISRPPAIELGAEGTNVRTRLQLAENRWVLFAWGKGVGPAVLYWGELVAFIVVAMILGRLRRTPLQTRDWLFLGLGLSTFSWWVLLVFGAWLFVLDCRPHWRIETRWRFNARQIALAILSVVALGTLISAIPYGLLGEPDMSIQSGDGYANGLSWFIDHTPTQLPQSGVLSVSIWYYRFAMLLWALWLSFALLRWLPWAWRQYSIEGFWRGKEPATVS